MIDDRNVLVPGSELGCSSWTILYTDSDRDRQDGGHDTDEAYPAQNRHAIKSLDGRQSESADHRHDSPCDGAGAICGDCVEGDRNGNEAGASLSKAEIRTRRKVIRKRLI